MRYYAALLLPSISKLFTEAKGRPNLPLSKEGIVGIGIGVLVVIIASIVVVVVVLLVMKKYISRRKQLERMHMDILAMYACL